MVSNVQAQQLQLMLPFRNWKDWDFIQFTDVDELSASLIQSLIPIVFFSVCIHTESKHKNYNRDYETNSRKTLIRTSGICTQIKCCICSKYFCCFKWKSHNFHFKIHKICVIKYHSQWFLSCAYAYVYDRMSHLFTAKTKAFLNVFVFVSVCISFHIHCIIQISFKMFQIEDFAMWKFQTLNKWKMSGRNICLEGESRRIQQFFNFFIHDFEICNVYSLYLLSYSINTISCPFIT